MSSIAVIGGGYVGLTTAACFAHLGHDVVCGDNDAEKVRSLSKGEVPVLEEGLPELVSAGLASRRLSFVSTAAAAASTAEFVFLCVPTPQGANGAADLSIVEAVAREIAPVLKPGSVVVNKSTVPIGSTELVERLLTEGGAVPGTIGVASNPEFLREGSAVRDFLEPHRVVIGCKETEVAVRVSELYRDLRAPILVTDAASAEMIKYASNAFLATKISFINQVANLCERSTPTCARSHSAWATTPASASSSCTPVPATAARASRRTCRRSSTRRRPRATTSSCCARCTTSTRSSTTGWSRRSPTPPATRSRGPRSPCGASRSRPTPTTCATRRRSRSRAGSSTAVPPSAAYDPAAGERAAGLVAGLEVASDPYEACEGADVLTVLTEWDEFRWLDFERVGASMRQRRVVDARNLLDPAAMRQRSFAYEGVGR